MKVTPITFEVEPGASPGYLRIRAQCFIDWQRYAVVLETLGDIPFEHVHRDLRGRMRRAIGEALFP